MRLQRVIQGRCVTDVTDADMASTKSLLDNNPDWNRCRLSRELCQRWNWRNQKGRFREDTRKLFVGFTAPPKRGDGKGLNSVFQEVVYARDLPEMIEAGYLSPVTVYRVETDVDLTSVCTRMGDFVAPQLSRVINIEERNALIVKIYREKLLGRPSLCFCVDAAHAEELAAQFRATGISAGCVTGNMERDARVRARPNPSESRGRPSDRPIRFKKPSNPGRNRSGFGEFFRLIDTRSDNH